MTEPPRSAGDGNFPDPTEPPNPYPGPQPPPSSGAGGYAPPPSSSAGGYGPPPPPGGYGPPPGPGAPGSGPPGPPPYGYGPPPGASAPAGFANNDERTWALVAHFGGILIGFIAPLITLLAKGNESPAVRAHSVEALNFQITWGIATIVASVLAACTFGVLFFLPIITWIVVIVFSIIGGLKANEGELYHYPMTWRVVK